MGQSQCHIPSPIGVIDGCICAHTCPCYEVKWPQMVGSWGCSTVHPNTAQTQPKHSPCNVLQASRLWAIELYLWEFMTQHRWYNASIYMIYDITSFTVNDCKSAKNTMFMVNQRLSTLLFMNFSLPRAPPYLIIYQIISINICLIPMSLLLRISWVSQELIRSHQFSDASYRCYCSVCWRKP